MSFICIVLYYNNDATFCKCCVILQKQMFVNSTVNKVLLQILFYVYIFRLLEKFLLRILLKNFDFI